MKEFSELEQTQVFKRKGLGIFLDRISHLFNCKANFIEAPLKIMNEICDFDITKNPEAEVYFSENESVFLLCKVCDSKKEEGVFAVELSGNLIKQYPKELLKGAAQSLGMIVTGLLATHFQDAIYDLDERMTRNVVSRCLSRGKYNNKIILFLLRYLENLKSMTYEAEAFSTGFILSHNPQEYSEADTDFRNGNLYKLREGFNLTDEASIHKREWFLANGNTSFYLADKDLHTEGLFIRTGYDPRLINFVDSYTLSKILDGKDIAFRIINKNQSSVVTAEGIEYMKIENVWKVRNYNFLMQFLKSLLELSHDFVNTLLFFVIYASQNKQSSIIWIPRDLSSSQKNVLYAHRFIRDKLSIFDAFLTPTIIRFLRSDGATVFEKDGTIPYFACKVRLNEINNEDITGTGEDAAQTLSKNGVAVKISKDGGIRIYYDYEKPPLEF